MTGVLENLRVIDFGRAIAGAYCTLLLGDMGAEIIKIEQVPPYEPPGQTPEEAVPTNEITHHWAMNRNKKAICINMKSESGKSVFYDLVKKSDVVFDNFRPQVLSRIGMDYETLKKYNSAIISCSVSGFGATGPFKDLPSYDLIAQAMGGGMSISGEPGGMPARFGTPVGDLAAGMFAAMGIMAAFIKRQKDGIGQRIDVSMLDCQLALQIYRVPRVFGMNETFGPTPRQSGGAKQSPYGPYKTKDGSWIAMAAGAVQFWERLCKATQLEHLITDVRFDTLEKRQENNDLMVSIFEDAFMKKTAAEWEKIFIEAKIPAAKVNTIKEAFLHPQAQAREMLIPIDHPLGKKMKFAGNPIKMPSNPDQNQYKPAPALGEHTKEILSQFLNYSDDKLVNLKDEGAIWWPEKGFYYPRGLGRFA